MARFSPVSTRPRAKSPASATPATMTRSAGWCDEPSALARRTNSAERRAASPAATPSAAAPARSRKLNAGSPTIGNNGWCPFSGDERQVASSCADEGGQEHPASEVVLVRHLQSEDRSRGGSLEDGGDARGCARHHEHAIVGAAEDPPQTRLRLRAERCTDVEGGALQPHGPAEPQRRHGAGQAAGKAPPLQVPAPIVEGAQVLVTGVGSSDPDDPQDDQRSGPTRRKARGRSATAARDQPKPGRRRPPHARTGRRPSRCTLPRWPRDDHLRRAPSQGPQLLTTSGHQAPHTVPRGAHTPSQPTAHA